MSDNLNKTTICAIVAMELVNFDHKSDAEKINCKYSLNQLVNTALKEYARYDRILLDKGDSLVMAYFAAPEDLLSIALDIRHQIMQHNAQGLIPIFVRMGVHLGAVRILQDVNDQPNFMGEGLDETRRIMRLARENAIVASPAYYAVTLPLSNEIVAQYAYAGFKSDVNATEYEAYELKTIHEIESSQSSQSQLATPVLDTPTEQPTHLPAYQPAKNHSVRHSFNWKYIIISVSVFAGLFGFVKVINAPRTPEITIVSSESEPSKISKPTIETPSPAMASQGATAVSGEQNVQALLPNETIETLPKESLQTNQEVLEAIEVLNNEATKTEIAGAAVVPEPSPANKRADKTRLTEKKLPEAVTEETTNQSAESAAGTTKEAKVTKAEAQTQSAAKPEAKKPEVKEKSGWQAFKESLKQGTQRACTQGEIALGQCK